MMKTKVYSKSLFDALLYLNAYESNFEIVKFIHDQ